MASLQPVFPPQPQLLLVPQALMSAAGAMQQPQQAQQPYGFMFGPQQGGGGVVKHEGGA